MTVDREKHELHHFMVQATQEMAAEYERIRSRATEDAGTAGDEGEENWAGVLREWLPPKYTVVTKGRIINSEGQASGQIDVLVLKDSYPRKLRDKKLYLAAGVAAAFECKTTLTAAHVKQAVKTGAEIKDLYTVREGTPYEELHSSVIYGLLAHSHGWKGPNSTPEENIDRVLLESDRKYIHHPRDSLDILCVADLASWTTSKIVLAVLPGNERSSDKFGPYGSAISSYGRQRQVSSSHDDYFTPIGALISYLSMRMAWEDPSFRSLANYYRAANLSGDGGGEYRKWDPRIYSDMVRSQIMAGKLSNDMANWDKWSYIYF